MADEGGRSYDPQKDAAAQEPLTANEAKLVTRLFGDPFAFPMEFKAWLRGWLEEQFPRINTLAVSAASGAAGAFVPPAGAILDYGGDVAPGGYVMCDGAEYDKTALAYQRLFNAVGFKYGTGSTENMFRVPDFQGRVAVGKGAHAEVDTLGDSEGVALGQRRPSHRHSVNESNVGFSNASIAAGADGYVMAGDVLNFELGTHRHDVLVGPQTGNEPTDTPAFLVVNKIISLGA